MGWSFRDVSIILPRLKAFFLRFVSMRFHLFCIRKIINCRCRRKICVIWLSSPPHPGRRAAGALRRSLQGGERVAVEHEESAAVAEGHHAHDVEPDRDVAFSEVVEVGGRQAL